MAQFETPQFIERQAKVIGPLTFRGAAYVGVPIILIFLLWFTIADSYFILFIGVSLLLQGAGVALAFVKLEGKTIPEVLRNAIFFFTRSRTYIWKRGNINVTFKPEQFINPSTNGESLPKNTLNRKSRIADLSVKVQTKK